MSKPYYVYICMCLFYYVCIYICIYYAYTYYMLYYTFQTINSNLYAQQVWVGGAESMAAQAQDGQAYKAKVAVRIIHVAPVAIMSTQL